MKKTLTTLALAAISASAAFSATLTPSFTLEGIANTTTGHWTATSDFGTMSNSKAAFTLTVVFNWGELVADIGTSTTQTEVLSTYGQASNAKPGQRAFSFASDGNGGLVAYATRVYGSTLTHTTPTMPTAGLSSLVKDDKLVLTMVMSADGITLYGFNANDNSIAELGVSASNFSSGNNYKIVELETGFAGTLDSLYAYNSSVTATADLVAISQAAYTAAIPEPATATLSLLALAGLAARRRRKD